MLNTEIVSLENAVRMMETADECELIEYQPHVTRLSWNSGAQAIIVQDDAYCVVVTS